MASDQGTGDPVVPVPPAPDEPTVVREVVEHLLHGIGLKGRVEVVADAAGYFVDVYSRRAVYVFSGRHANALPAIQQITQLIVRRRFPHVATIYLCLAGQRQERMRNLQGKTVAVARLVIESGKEMALDMVYQYEMPVIREALSAFPTLRVHAVDVGDELRRNAVIAPKQG